MNICLWVFPERDFADWCELVGSPQVASYGEYLTLLAAVQADQERQGHRAARIAMTVAAMRAGLAARGLENTPDARATVLAFAYRPTGD